MRICPKCHTRNMVVQVKNRYVGEQYCKRYEILV